MNERIRELAELAKFSIDVSNDPNSPPSWWAAGHNECFEKFAELIVKECADFIAQGEFGDSGTAKQLIEHFGVDGSKCRTAIGINSIHNACMFRAGCRQAEAALSTQLLALQAANSANVLLQKELAALRDVLIHSGFVECDIPACNCGSWHQKYGLPERWAEIKELLCYAEVLNNDTGNTPLNAIKKLISQLAERDAEIARLREYQSSRHRFELSDAAIDAARKERG